MESLESLLDAWIEHEVEQNPVLGTAWGVPGHDDRLGDASAEAFMQAERADDEWMARLDAIDAATLTLDEQIDRDLVRSALAGRQVTRPWQAWRRDPSVYTGPCLNGVLLLFIHRPLPAKELAAAAAARMEQIPQVLAEATANLDAELANAVIVERALGQCQAGVTYARTLVPAEVETADLRQQLAEAGEIAARALEDFAEYLRGLAEQANGPYAIGDELYSGLLTRRELLGYGAAELRRRGQAAYDELDGAMGRVAYAIAGHRNWRKVMEELNGDHPPTPEAMRAEYEAWTARCRQFLIDQDLVTLPDGERCLVEPTPPFLRPTAGVASYQQPAPFSASTTGRFYVPWPPDGAAPERVEQMLQTNAYASIPTITAHETYPGHHWHLTWLKERGRRIRSVVRTPYFVEGWALYAEAVMRERGFFSDPRHELAHLDARIFRAARIIVDTSLHTGDMTFDEAVTFMSTKASLSQATARAEVSRYCAWPTQAASYLTGALEIERIRSSFLDEGRGDERAFHDAIGATGGLPIALAERAVLS